MYRMTKGNYFEELTDGLFKKGWRWENGSVPRLMRMPKKTFAYLANSYRYGSWERFLSDLDTYGLALRSRWEAGV